LRQALSNLPGNTPLAVLNNTLSGSSPSFIEQKLASLATDRIYCLLLLFARCLGWISKFLISGQFL
jgi:hypothetical protein